MQITTCWCWQWQAMAFIMSIICKLTNRSNDEQDVKSDRYINSPIRHFVNHGKAFIRHLCALTHSTPFILTSQWSGHIVPNWLERPVPAEKLGAWCHRCGTVVLRVCKRLRRWLQTPIRMLLAKTSVRFWFPLAPPRCSGLSNGERSVIARKHLKVIIQTTWRRICARWVHIQVQKVQRKVRDVMYSEKNWHKKMSIC